MIQFNPVTSDTGLCGIFVGILAVLTNKWFILNTSSLITEPFSHYDYIIVGAGTTGCVLAAELTIRSDLKILLVEAGSDYSFISSIPLAATFLQGSKNDWSFKTESQLHSSFGMLNEKQFIPRGKGLGGSGKLNYMIHEKPSAQGYKNWLLNGIYNWNNIVLEPYFRKITKQYKENEPTLKLTNTSSEKYPLLNVFQNAIQQLNRSEIRTIPIQNTVHKGKRWSSYEGYLTRVLNNPNLHVLLNTHVKKILFSGNRATGVETDLELHPLIFARKEVILSAGAIQTPQLLMLSGIGNTEELRKLNLTIKCDLPGVGRNLHDHINVPLYVSIDYPYSVTIEKLLTIREVWNYFVKNTGMFSLLPIMGIANSQESVGLVVFGMGSTDERILRSIANYQPDIFDKLFPFHRNVSQEGFVFLISSIFPKSRGIITLRSADYRSHPIIDPNYLQNYLDVENMIKGIKLVNDIIKTSPFQDIGAKIHWPNFDQCSKYQFYSNNFLECIIRIAGLTGYHPAGTCKMGSYEDLYSVVDENLKVKGIYNLRVMDASIMPTPLCQFPNSVLIAMAEHAVSIILGENK